MSTMNCIEESYASYLGDVTLILATVLGYIAMNACVKWHASVQTTARVAAKAADDVPTPSSDSGFAEMPVEVQARIALLAGLPAWAAAASTNNAHNSELAEKDAVWSHIAGRATSKPEYRRSSVGLEGLATHKLDKEEAVTKAHGMLRGMRAEDNLDGEFVKLFARTAEGSHNLFWNGVGEAGVSVASLGEAACKRSELFSEDQRIEIARLVGEHEELSSLCSVPMYPEEDYGAVIRSDYENQLEMQLQMK